MARRDEMVQRVDERDLSPATQGADLSAVEGQPEGHWRGQAEQRDAATPTEDAPAAAAPVDSADREAPPARSPESETASEEGGDIQSTSQQAGGDASQDISFEISPRVSGEMEWSGPDGSTHTRDFEVGANLNSATAIDAVAQTEGVQTTRDADSEGGALGGVANAPLSVGGLGQTLDGLATPVSSAASGLTESLEAGVSTLADEVGAVVEGVTGGLDAVSPQLDGVTARVEDTLSGVEGGLDDIAESVLGSNPADDLLETGSGGMLDAIFQPDDAPMMQDLADPVVSGEPIMGLSDELDDLDVNPGLAGLDGLLGDTDADAGLLGGDVFDDNPLGL